MRSESSSRPWNDVTDEVGVDFRHDARIRGDYYYPEATAPGAALFDYDGDGDLDLFLVQSASYGSDVLRGVALESRGGPDRTDGAATHRLYRNHHVESGAEAGSDSSGTSSSRESLFHFVDVTEASGIERHGYGQGVATGDYDNDGWVDLYVTAFGANTLWRNRGDGTFEEVPSAAGADDDGWGQSAAFFDYDGDGWLDLWVTNYLRYELRQVKECFSPRGRRDYCGPTTYDGAADVLYRNDRGRFVDVSLDAGIAEARSSSMGVVTADFDGDGLPDVYVTNDQRPNHLWRNLGDGRFEDVAMFAGAALSGSGLAESSMGVDAADVDGDLDFDLVLTHLAGETNTLYRNDENGWFVDRSQPSGVGAPSLASTGFGVAFADFDLDGELDFAVANGAVKVDETLEIAGDPWPYHQADQLFLGVGDGSFRDATREMGEAWTHSAVGRGLAVGDLDDDGDADLVFADNDAPTRILRNDLAGPDGARWIGARVLLPVGDGSRDAYGALVRLEVSEVGGAPSRLERVTSEGSYLSANDPRVRFGGLPASEDVALVVRWPDGVEERFEGLAAGRYHDLVRGLGRPVATS